jgi:hypothetical protein
MCSEWFLLLYIISRNVSSQFDLNKSPRLDPRKPLPKPKRALADQTSQGNFVRRLKSSCCTVRYQYMRICCVTRRLKLRLAVGKRVQTRSLPSSPHDRIKIFQHAHQ